MFTFIIYVIGLFVFIRWLLRLIIPAMISASLRKAQQKSEQRYHADQQKSNKQPQDYFTGDTAKKRTMHQTEEVGEYIDYEEVKK